MKKKVILLNIIIIAILCNSMAYNITLDRSRLEFGKKYSVRINGCEIYYDNFYKENMIKCYNNLILTSIHSIINITLPSIY